MEVYLDNNATTQLAKEVKKRINKVTDIYGNPSSLHKYGNRARNIVEKSRDKLSKILNCSAEEIIFTSGGTEADNIAILGYLKNSEKKHIVTTRVEHHAVLNVFKYLEKNGYDVTWLEVDENGRISPSQLKKALNKQTALVSIILANNEVGTVQPVKEAVKEVKDYSEDIMVHTDAVQAMGKMEINVSDMGVDLLSLSGHKFNGPKGTGLLYLKQGVNLSPIMFGGHHEHGLKPGTENVPGIAGLALAAGMASGGLESTTKKFYRLKKRLWNGISEKINNVRLNGNFDNTLSNTLNVSFKGVEGESIVMMLDMEGIAVSTGSACTSETLETSHVLKAMEVEPIFTQGAIRFSLGKDNTEEEIDYVIKKLPPIIDRLRKMSPVGEI
ncbi:MAG: cysteine desulfurase family protein [Elusimicrobiota bacterium]